MQINADNDDNEAADIILCEMGCARGGGRHDCVRTQRTRKALGSIGTHRPQLPHSLRRLADDNPGVLSAAVDVGVEGGL